ncbi:sialate O-acetylesterase [uncultured Bacteroides sp.]|uniref:sialate O-acetylesterase n=1 Tax=uncultured Bacteroides sp. TaxID=162156 RepID=UPI002620F6A0|nr:sialate O-acetylesterase [uncultured Bacteroides sp.]
MKKRLITALCLSLFLQAGAFAKVLLPEILSDNMVLQQNTEVKLWGTAKAGAEVKVTPSWSKQTYTVKADKDGKWLLKVATPAASYDTYSITFSDGEDTTLQNILIGEVWFCSGQSNMEMPLNGFWNCPIEGANEMIATAGQWKGIRVATIEKNGQLEPVDNCKGSWKVSNPANAPAFSATAFNFATLVNQVLDVPIGIINCSWGGSMVEGWLPASIVKTYPDIDLKRDIRKEEPHDWWHYLSPTLMYNGMLHPLENYTIKGYLWYQGESNVGKHDTYAERLKTMVELWRKEWGQGELPFYYVEIAPYGAGKTTGSALLREAQFKAQSIIPNSAMICTNDLVEPYEAWNIHPKDKKTVGHRLAYLALEKTYGIQGIRSVGPVYRSMEVKDNTIILSFDNADDGFNRMKGMEGFEVAGNDHVFYPAQAEVYDNNKIRVSCPDVANPVAVRYAFRDFQVGNVKNMRELPLYPFRTDNWDW